MFDRPLKWMRALLSPVTPTDVPYAITIDPSRVTSDQYPYLSAFLEEYLQKGTRFFVANKAYPCRCHGGTQISFTCDVTWRRCGTDRYDYHWDCHETTLIGVGAFGSVKKIAKRLDVRLHDIVHSEVNLSLVVKNQLITAGIRKIAHKEYDMMRRVPQCKVREPTRFMSETAMAMAYIPGVTLEQILTERQLEGEPLTGDMLFAIAIDMLRAYAKQITANHIVHGDIKPSNMMIDSGHLQFIDFGFSHDVNDLKHISCGSAGYRAPELCNGGIPSRLSDYYSLGCVLGQLFNTMTPDPLHARVIEEAISKMVDTSPELRVTSEDMLVILENVSVGSDKAVAVAHSLGVMLRWALSDFADKQPIIDIDKIDHIEKCLHEVLEKVDETAIHVFLDRADVLMLKHAKSKNEVIQNVNMLVESYKFNKTQLLLLKQRADNRVPIQQQVAHLLDKENCLMTLDNMAWVNFSFGKRVQIISDQLDQLLLDVPSNSSHRLT
jgi:serine/threonine protein kinase